MKKLHQFAFAAALITLLAACQSTADPKKILLNRESRTEIIQSITNSNEMMNEMMEAILNNNNAKMVMQKNEKMIMMMMENRDTVMKVLKDNPTLRQYMMSDMMEVCKNDSSAMSGMCKTMMGNQKMVDMMEKMKGEKMDMKDMKGMEHKK